MPIFILFKFLCRNGRLSINIRPLTYELFENVMGMLCPSTHWSVCLSSETIQLILIDFRTEVWEGGGESVCTKSCQTN